MRALSCRRARALVVASRDGRMGLDARLELDRHLASCAACRDFDARDADLEQALAQLDEPPVERIDLEAQVRAVRAGIEARERLATARRRRLRPVAIALALAAALLLAVLLVRRTPPAPVETPRPLVGIEPAQAASADPPPRAEGPAMDPARLAEARARVAAALDSAAALEGGVEPRLERLAQPFEQLQREGWPVARLVERHLDAGEPARAGLAARWLGRSDDRLSTAAVAALVRDARAPDALRAQALEALLESRDTGAARRAALLAALDDAGMRARALAGLGAADDAQVAGDLRARLFDGGALDAQRDLDLCAVLAQRGDEGLDALAQVAAAAPSDSARRAALAVLARDTQAQARLAARLQERGDPAAARARLRTAAELGLPAALEAMRRAALERPSRASALTALAVFPTGEGWELLFELWSGGRVPERELVDAARDRLARGGELEAALGGDVALDAALEVLLALESPAAAPHLLRLAQERALELDQRQWALAAALEVAGADELGTLAALLRGCEPGELRLAAACAQGLFALGGRAALTEALGPGGEDVARELDALFSARPADRNRPVTLSRASRLLEPWLAADFPGRPRTEP